MLKVMGLVLILTAAVGTRIFHQQGIIFTGKKSPTVSYADHFSER